MILESLVAQIEQRFQHEKRAQVCLWFDEKREFARLLPALRAHLEQQKEAPFTLLEYEAAALHGQIWLKYRVHRILSQAASPDERRRLRFVLYLPLSEDRLDAPADTNGDDAVRLDLLAEYRTGGVLWRIGGKRPTLFSFLRTAGVALPDNPTDQRRLWEGGRDSLLSKYIAKFVDKPAVFWETVLTPEVAQSRLIGDVDQAILDLAVDPDGSWKGLQEKALDREFLALVRERYGFEESVQSPGEWVEHLVAILALTEAYLGYYEPADFPFAERLPPMGVRPNHKQLLQRWLRDTEYRAAWDRWIAAVETKIDLTPWAKGGSGLAFGFPHLVRLRWQEVLTAFEEAASKVSRTAEFFERHGEVIGREAEFAKASPTPVGAWDLLRDLGALLRACGEGEHRAKNAPSSAALVRVYVECAGQVDLQHVEVRRRAEEQGLPAVTRTADRAYASYANTLNEAFFQHIATKGVIEIPGLPTVTAHLEQTIWKAKGRRAVMIVDALRYDCALSLKTLLRGHAVDVEPVMAMLPTVTAVGMTALLPLGDATVVVETKGNTVHPKVNGQDAAVRANRLALLAAFGADCRDIKDIEACSDPPGKLGELLVVFGHDEVDDIGHGEAQTLIRHVNLEIERLARLIRKLHRWGYGRVHVVTDHGFILLDESRLPDEVPCEKAWCHVLKERFALVPAKADVPLVRLPFAWDPDMRVAVPPGLAFFKAEKSFSHGGATLQELVIPHVTSRGHAAQEKRIGVEVVLPTFELQRTAVKVTLRPVSAAAAGPAQMALFTEVGRTLSLDVLRQEEDGKLISVLAGKPKEVRLEAKGVEESVTLFFHSSASFRQGEQLELDIRDIETLEQFPPGGIVLRVGRDM
jgi:hypothetical protein